MAFARAFVSKYGNKNDEKKNKYSRCIFVCWFFWSIYLCAVVQQTFVIIIRTDKMWILFIAMAQNFHPEQSFSNYVNINISVRSNSNRNTITLTKTLKSISKSCSIIRTIFLFVFSFLAKKHLFKVLLSDWASV